MSSQLNLTQETSTAEEDKEEDKKRALISKGHTLAIAMKFLVTRQIMQTKEVTKTKSVKHKYTTPTSVTKMLLRTNYREKEAKQDQDNPDAWRLAVVADLLTARTYQGIDVSCDLK